MTLLKDFKVVAAGTLPLEHFGIDVPGGNRRSARGLGQGGEGRGALHRGAEGRTLAKADVEEGGYSLVGTDVGSSAKMDASLTG